MKTFKSASVILLISLLLTLTTHSERTQSSLESDVERSELHGQGISDLIQLGITNIAQLDVSEAVINASHSIDIEFQREIGSYAKSYVYLEAGKGSTIEDNLDMFSGVNADAVDSDDLVRVNEAWYEHYIKSLPLTLTFGKLDATRYIDDNAYANDETSQFLAFAFTNSPAIPFPDYSPGIRIAFEHGELADLNLVYLDADSDWKDITKNIFIGGQLNIKPNLLGREGNYRLLGWIDTRPHIKWKDASKDQERRFGFGISLDQEVSDFLGIFARFGWQDPTTHLEEEEFSLENAFSVGAELTGKVWGRTDDVLGVGLASIAPSKDYKESKDNLKGKSEIHLEIYYNLKLNDNLNISPDLQMILNPYGGDSDRDNLFIIGLRFQSTL